MMFGAVFIVLIACVGSGYDMNQLISTKQKASSIADTAALTAAVYYSEHGEMPQSLNDGLVHNHEYDASALSYAFNGLSNKMARNVKIRVAYDETNKEVTSYVSGHTEAAFMQIFGHQNLEFETTATAKFSEVEIGDPATLMFVLDNSGSMEFDDLPYGMSQNPKNPAPAGTKKRLDALESATRGMMGKLRNILNTGSDTNGRSQRIVRTALIPYSSTVLTNVDVPGQWGLLSDSQINAMYYRTGTNSAPPLDDALDVMKAYDASDTTNEAKIHIDEHGDDPLRYVIFMTDGQNNGSFDIWDARSGTDTWRRWREATTEPVNCSRYWRRRGRRGGYWVYYEDDSGSYTCNKNVPEGWEYEHNSPDMPVEGSGWEEGVMDNQSNLDSRSTCATMHSEGVQVFTISFGLQPGWFYTNNWGIATGTHEYEISSEATERAKELMRYCASSPQNYTDAIDSVALAEAFEKIGDQIVRELIRLKS